MDYTLIKKAVTSLFLSALLSSLLFSVTPRTFAQASQIRFIPGLVDVNDNGQVVTVACVVEDVADLAGVDIQIKWSATYLDYISHTLTVPVESYPPPVPPSSYGGILHAPPLIVKDEVNATAGTYWAAASTLGGPGFYGNGAVFNITFQTHNIPFGPVGEYFDTYIELTSTTLADSGANPISHTTVDGVVRIWYKEFQYPEWPLLKVEPEIIECFPPVGGNITFDVYLMGKNMDTGELVDLDPFWDVAGFEAILNYDVTMLDFLEGEIDPDNWFESFWPGGLYVITSPFEDIPGHIKFAFTGIPAPSHTPVSGSGRVLTVTLRTISESSTFPPESSAVYLNSRQIYITQHNFDSIGGTIDLVNPVGSTFYELSPDYGEGPLQIMSWVDDDGDGELSSDDHFMMEDLNTGFYFNYLTEKITCTLNLTLAKSLDDYIWPATFPLSGLQNNGLPGKTVGTPPPNPYDGFGGPWSGNFSTTYPVSSVNSITVHALPFTADEYNYTLTEGVDFIVHDADNLIELLHPLDDVIINEHWVDGVNNTLNGWPYINYVASGISSVYVKFPNGTERYATNGYAQTPPSEWWYDPDWPWELEGWWALGYFCPAAYCWPDGSEWWINYTAVPYMTIDYNTDQSTVFVEYDGNHTECLAITNASGTHWNEISPRSWQSYDVLYHEDVDISSSITLGDFFHMEDLKQFLVSGVSTDIECLRESWVSNENPDPGEDPFFGVKPCVIAAAFPHPERDFSPWFNEGYSGLLPVTCEDALFVECFRPTGCFIDVYTQYPNPHGGQGFNKSSDMFWPQKNVHLCANVTHSGWPEQNKDVAFEVIDPHGVTWGVWYGRTNAIGVACVDVRLPWPCDDPEYWFGEWTVIATVDCACVVINDTLTFKYDYRVHITDVELNKDEYKHCEDILITVHWLTRSMSDYNITFTVTAVDASGVPFGFDYITVTIGGAIYCSYTTGEVQLVVHVEKWVRPPIGTLYVGALSDFPQNGGAAETPNYVVNFSILPEWA